MIEQLKNKKIGIWGFGITGQSLLRYLYPLSPSITIFEKKELSPDVLDIINQHNASLFSSSNLEEFLSYNDCIIASPGIDLDPYQHHAHKFIAELDLFQNAHHKKTIAITGSAGKTSITHLLDQLLTSAGLHVTTGGNIGTGMLDLLANDNTTQMYLLELSSFQLEQCTQFAPDLAIITNLYPNHLDRHKTMERYFLAKYRCITNQKPDQIALLPLSLIQQCNAQLAQPHKRAFFSWHTPNADQLSHLRQNDTVFYTHDGYIIKVKNNTERCIFRLSELPALSYKENWLIIISALFLLDVPLSCISACSNTLTLPEHRLEKVATINQIDFYNDSKSTTNQAAIAAVNALQGRPLYLFLGGLSKGVDRTPLIDYLHDRVAHVYCFGKEAEQLRVLCHHMNIPCTATPSLEQAFALCVKKITAGDQVLLSPGGASFDLFKDYEERGRIFKQIVYAFNPTKTKK